MNITLHRALVVCVLAGALALAVALLVLPKAASAAPPEPVDFPPETLGPEYCGFPVLYEVSGKTKVIDLPNGDTLFKNPGGRVTLTNLETDEQVSYVVAGTGRLTELEGGELLVVSTGRTVLNNPSIGILVPIGRFTFVIDEEGNFSQPTGNGRLIDACARLA
ncbi:MAG: hypothetical protein AVDCRST_MAG05-3929 [uncultured Rubrobacteraceae bacterium]|uniref:FecR protein domain-containing protein n=1 Tax=uncultured Rubrobacteraceae bacterium TaxID=349277 RepID=A0A6J4TL54_9ACTN|nr:MAG: hypothetical protein AVDCRST_MAG05-3929 [uncultured Rubrobacteraceae bacterium]